MGSRLKIIGSIIAIIGVIAVLGGGYGWTQVQAGANALQGFSKAQNVTLTYNADGKLVDRGTTEGADAIMALLKDTWGWPVNQGDLNPNDPLVNTGTEYMYQMATIAHHTLDGTTTVTLTAPVAYDGNGDKVVDPTAPTYTPETLPQGATYVEMLSKDAIFAAGHVHRPDRRALLHPVQPPAPARRPGTRPRVERSRPRSLRRARRRCHQLLGHPDGPGARPHRGRLRHHLRHHRPRPRVGRHGPEEGRTPRIVRPLGWWHRQGAA